MTNGMSTELLLTLMTAVITGCIEIIVTLVRKSVEDETPTAVIRYSPKVEPEDNQAEGSAGGPIAAIALIVLALTLLSQCN